MKRQIFKLMRSNSVRIIKGMIHFTKHNSNWILAGLATLGVTGLTWSAISNTIKAVKLCEQKEVLGKKEILKTTWKLYIPTIGFFLLTTVSIFTNAKVNARRLATMTGLLALERVDKQQLKDSIKEMIGQKKAKDVEANADQKRLADVPYPKEEDICKTGHGNLLYQDYMTGQFFRACPEYIEALNARMNEAIHSEVDNIIYRRMVSEKLNLRPNGLDDCFWDLYEMRSQGYNKIDIDCTEIRWMELNGQQEHCCIMRFIPDVSEVG